MMVKRVAEQTYRLYWMFLGLKTVIDLSINSQCEIKTEAYTKTSNSSYFAS